MASGRASAPQTWNRYTYSLNNPLRFTDPTGLNPEDIGTAEDQRRQRQAQQPPPQQPQQPVIPCPVQDFIFSVVPGNYTAQELSEITQTAVGEAGTTFTAGEVEAVIGTVVNRQNINIFTSPGYLYSSGSTQILPPSAPGVRGQGILSEYDAYRFRSGEKKLDQEKRLNNGVLPENSYVCDQLQAARTFAVQAANMTAAQMAAQHPYTSNRGVGREPPQGAVNVTQMGNTRFFVDRNSVKVFRELGAKIP